VLQGAVTGTILQSGDENYAVLAGTGAAGSTITTPIKYHLPSADTRSVITGLAPNTTYAVSTARDACDFECGHRRRSGDEPADGRGFKCVRDCGDDPVQFGEWPYRGPQRHGVSDDEH
jgi:hypothetical protein